MTRHTLHPSAARVGGKPGGFTLVELLVSVGILMLMAALLLPAVNSARARGKGVVCQNNQRLIWQGWVLFATDHESRLPGSRVFWDATGPDETSWLGGPYRDDDTASAMVAYRMRPQAGTIFKYVNSDFRVFRCPALEANPPTAFPGPGAGSNGRYDYAAFTTFAGCMVAHVPVTATFHYKDGRTIIVPTPTICEEEASTLNGGSWSESHANIKELGHQHWGGSFYASPDGSVNWFAEPWDCDADNWYVVSKGGNPVCMGAPDPQVGIWEYGWNWFERIP